MSKSEKINEAKRRIEESRNRHDSEYWVAAWQEILNELTEEKGK